MGRLALGESALVVRPDAQGLSDELLPHRQRLARDRREGLERGSLLGAQRARMPVDDAERPDPLATGQGERSAGVEADVRRAWTSGFPAKRGSAAASGTSNRAPPSMAWAQKATSRGVSLTPGRPTFALNHCRCSSTRLSKAMGAPQTLEARRAMASNTGSGAVSRTTRSTQGAQSGLFGHGALFLGHGGREATATGRVGTACHRRGRAVRRRRASARLAPGRPRNGATSRGRLARQRLSSPPRRPVPKTTAARDGRRKSNMPKSESGQTPSFLEGGGKTGALMRAIDWAATPLGDPWRWPPELGTLVGVMLGSSQPMFVAWGPERCWVYNEAYAPLLGNKHPRAIGLPGAEVWPEVFADALEPMFEVVFAGGSVSRDDIALVLFRGGEPEEAHFSFSYSPVRGSGGSVDGLFCACMETTAKVQSDRRAAAAAAALTESEARYRSLFESMGEGFCVIEAVRQAGEPSDFRYVAANPAFKAATGGQDVVGGTIRELFPEEPREWLDIYDRVADTGEAVRFERGLVSAGSVLDVYAYRLAEGGQGQAQRVGVVFLDVTERKRAQDERDRIADRLRALNADLERQVADRARERGVLWSITSDLVGVLDGAGVFESTNPAWQKTLGWSAEQLARTPVFDLMHPEDVGPSRAAFERLVGGEALLNFVNRYRGADGSYRWISWVAVPERGKYYCSGRDVTAEREARAELERAQEALRQAQKMEAVGQLTGGLAHDFNNLLAGISASLEILERRIGQGRVEGLERYIAAARGSTRRAASLTQRLLAFSRRQTLDPKPVDANRLVAGMEELIRRSVGPQVELEVVGAGGLWTVKVDAPQLESALLNLCINGRDAMAPDGGKLTIETANKWLDDRSARERDLAPGQYVSLCVTDTGVGMDAEVQARAFDPFFTTKPMGEGTGLGLSMVYGFARQSGGQVRIYSEIGKGTTMCLYFPRHLGPADGEEFRPADLADMGDGETVLVVEDEATIRQFVAEELAEGGYRCLEAFDGAAAMRVLQSTARIDLLVTDVGLPGGMNGRQVADAARVARPGLKVLFITGFADNAAVGNGHLDPGMEVLTKPFDMSALSAKIRDMLDR